MYMIPSAGSFSVSSTVISTCMAPIALPESVTLWPTISLLFNHVQVLVCVASGPWITNCHEFCRSAQRVVLVNITALHGSVGPDTHSPNGSFLVA